MANEPVITICGNAVADAEMRFLPSGAACCSFTVAVTPRVKKGDVWSDGETTFYRCTAWRQLAETAAESITRGMRLLVHGRLLVRTFEKDGERRTSIDVDVEHVGAEMRYAVVSARKAGREKSQQPPATDPWSDVPPADEPPF